MTISELKKDFLENQKRYFFWFSIGTLILSILVAAQVATQYIAFELNYWRGLGWNINHFYPTYDAYFWISNSAWQKVSGYPQIASNAEYIFLFLAFSIFIGLGIIYKKFLKKLELMQTSSTLHGSDRWAIKKDLEKGLLLPEKNDDFSKSVFIGGWRDKDGKFNFLRYSGKSHVLAYAPTRSGKGVGLVIPTLLTWRESAIVFDMKGELKAFTAGWRNLIGQNVLYWEPANSKNSVSWNPLEEIRMGTDDEIADIQNLATMIVYPEGKDKEDHWTKTAAAAFSGLIAHELYSSKAENRNPTLAKIDDFLSPTEIKSAIKIQPPKEDDDENLPHWMKNKKAIKKEKPEEENHDGKEMWESIFLSKVYPTGEKNADGTDVLGAVPLAAKTARDMIDTPDKEYGSKMSTLKSYLDLYRDPAVQKNMERCDFRLTDLKNRKKATTVYIVVQQVDKDRLKPLVKLFLNMSIRALCKDMEFADGTSVGSGHQILYMLDEFPSMGKQEIVEEALAYAAGYGIKFYLICQDLSQLWKAYTKDQSITSNCAIQIAYPPTRQETADYISKQCGTTTIRKQATTNSGNLKKDKKSGSREIIEVQRPLLTPGEVLRMKAPQVNKEGLITKSGEMVVMMSGFPSIRGEQILYFQNQAGLDFLSRAKIPAPKLSSKMIAGSDAEIYKPKR